MSAAEFEMEIHDLAFGGKGVGRHEGKAVFVHGVAPGERVRVRPRRVRDRLIEAELVEVLKASPDRVEPPCPAYGACGGCAYQHLAYPAQLAAKAMQVEQTLRRIGKLADVPMRPIVGSPSPLGYRNRIRVHVQDGVIGFVGRDHRSLVDIARCALAEDAVNARLAAFRSGPRPGDGDVTLAARGGSFFEQTNDAVAALLREAVVREAGDGAVLVDAYCGAGFFAKALRDRFTEVVGIESHPGAVHRARADALEHERYFEGDVAAEIAPVLAEFDPGKTVVIVDPPAAGLDAAVVEALLAFRPARLLYVSCDPGTLARDMGRLAVRFAPESVTPFDMFPQTAGVEVLAVLRPTVA